jgi:hypothetical protein
MRILALEFRNFRGFENAVIKPSGHVALVGEPGAGRSDVIEGLERVLWPDAVRARVPTDLDFFRKDRSRRAEVELVLGDLDAELEQRFFDHLELWDREAGAIVEELGDPQLVDREKYDLAVRMCYRISWNTAEDEAEHWVDYPKSSSPDAGLIDRVPRADREAIPFAGRSTGRPLDLSSRGVFRRLLEESPGDDFGKALEALAADIEKLAEGFSGTGQLAGALGRVLDAARIPLGLPDDKSASEVVKFMPEGGSIAGLARSLGAAVDLLDGPGALPLARHGSTVAAVLTVAQAMASVGGKGIVAIDDFGEGLDASATQHFAACLRRAVGQLWLSSRRSHAVEAFLPEEIVRLARERPSGRRKVFYGRAPKTKAERLAARHLTLQLLPSMASRAVLVLEGPHDRAAFSALAQRLFEGEGVPLPAARGIGMIDAGAGDSSGGSSAVPRLAAAARDLGLRAVALIDHDRAVEQVQRELEANLKCADAVVRLPEGCAIERALLSGLSDDAIKGALRDVGAAFDALVPPNLDDLSSEKLHAAAVKALKDRGGVHAQFIQALPAGQLPPLARRALQEGIAAATGATSGLVQL